MRTTYFKKIGIFLLVFVVVASAQKDTKPSKTKPAAAPATTSSANNAAEDISGMYSFLKEGEFVQFNLDQDGVSGYISRLGATDSDQGEVLDQFFTKAEIRGHDVSFTTKPLHSIWFEFKGHFARGAGKTKAEDAFYIVRGTLTEFSGTGDKATSHSREVEFKWLAQPDEKSSNLTKR